MGEVAEAPVRRPLRSRGKPWAWALARRLTAWRVSPNLISAMSMVFAAAAGLSLAFAPRVDGPFRAGGGQHFVGPMAKPHRMAAMTAASLLAAGLATVDRIWPQRLMAATLAIILAGCAVTMARRLRRTAAELRTRV
jgi:hypothetical protein